MKQLPLSVGLQDRATFANYLPGANLQALDASRSVAQGSSPLLYLHGIAGTGRSHLLQAICAATPGAGYFPLEELRDIGTEVLEGVAGLPVVAIDDLDLVAGAPEWEARLFSLYNECLATGARLAVAAGVPARDLPLSLPDLASRFAAMPHYALRPLDEAQQGQALRLRAAQRGIELPPETLLYLQRHFARDVGSLHRLLDHLDVASLEEQRRLTLPFIREVLERKS
jgi:DnaA-homolog protein